MSEKWEQSNLQQLISDGTQESLTLEYKAAASLDKADRKMTEITKDVSAMANSSGGIIVYGIKEYDAEDKRHLPEKIDPIEQEVFSKEWLEQVINNIRPKIDGLIIHPVPLDAASSHVAYVIQIPQSPTAHQATDFRYYKRFNFQAVPMEDYEVRDTMGRQQFPKFKVDFEIEITTSKSFNALINDSRERTSCKLNVIARNVGRVYAQYVNTFIQVPISFLPDITLEQIKARKEATIITNGKEYYEYFEANTVRDVVDMEFGITGSIPKYGPSRYSPILPGLSRTWEIILRKDFEQLRLNDMEIGWTLYADNALPGKGVILVKDIKVIDLREKSI